MMGIKPYKGEDPEDFAIRVHVAAAAHVGQLLQGTILKSILADLQRNADYLHEHTDGVEKILDDHSFEYDDPHEHVIPAMTKLLGNETLASEIYSYERLRWFASEYLVELANVPDGTEAETVRTAMTEDFARSIAELGDMDITHAHKALHEFTNSVELSLMTKGGHISNQENELPGIPEELELMREEAKAKLYAGDFAIFRTRCLEEARREKIDIETLMKDVMREWQEHGRDEPWIAFAMPKIEEILHCDEKRAAKLAVVFMFDHQADTLCNLVYTRSQIDRQDDGPDEEFILTKEMSTDLIADASQVMALLLEQSTHVGKYTAQAAVSKYVSTLSKGFGLSGALGI